jgi:adenosine kinase
MLSLSAPFIAQFFKDQLEQVLPYTDVIIGNEAEAEAFSQSQGWGITDLVEIGKKMATLPKVNKQRSRIIIITHGTEPTISVVSNAAGELEVKHTPIRTISPQEINDTNGAG